MADKEASLLIRLKDEASAGLNTLTGTLAKVAAGLAAVKVLVIDSVQAYMEQEAATTKMNNALKNQGIFTEELSKEMLKYSDSIQQTTAFSDEAVLSQMSLLTTFGLAGKDMRDASAAARDMATSLGMDLNTATMLVGKAFQGNTAALSRYGITLKEGLDPTEKFSSLIEQLNSRFGGSSAAFATTYAGQLAIMKNQFGELQEEIGQAVIPVFSFLMTKLLEVFNVINSFGGLGNTLALMFASFAAGIVKFVTTALSSIPGVSQLFKLMGVDLKGISEQLDANVQGMIMAAQQEAATGGEMLLNQKIRTAQSIAIEKEAAAEKAKVRAAEFREKKKDLDAGYQAYLANNKAIEDEEKELNRKRIAAAEDTLSRLASFQNSKNSEMAAVGKASAIALATIDTYRGATGAYASLSSIPYVGFALATAAAAAIIAAGLANVAQISGVQLAKGGVVMPTSGGTMATIAEAGRPEAVIPLGDSRTSELLSGAGLGGMNLTINIGTLLGTENNVRELAIMIDRELFTLRRNNESISLGAI